MADFQRSRDKKRTTARARGRYFPRRKVCAFCVEKTEQIDYKDQAKLRRYISERGRIEPRRRTGTCAKHQRALAIALKRARHIALLPFVAAHIRETGGTGVRQEVTPTQPAAAKPSPPSGEPQVPAAAAPDAPSSESEVPAAAVPDAPSSESEAPAAAAPDAPSSESEAPAPA